MLGSSSFALALAAADELDEAAGDGAAVAEVELVASPA